MASNLDDTLNSISAILDWYSTNCDSTELAILMRAADKLSVHSYNLSDFLADSQTEFNNFYFIRKIGVSKKVNDLVKQGTAVNKADHEALVANEDAFNSEKEKESESFKASVLLKQVNKVLDRMNQRISLMKLELNKG